MTIERYGIATLAAGSAAVAALSSVGITQEPRGEWIEGEIVDLADGNIRYNGNPRARWVWDHIRGDVRAVLRTYCTGASEELYIQTIDNEGTFDVYRAIMRWPAPEKTRPGWPRAVRWDFAVEFLILETAP